jgi:hypothetical protein
MLTHRGRGAKTMPKPAWRLMLVGELRSDVVSETERARIERDTVAAAETIGLTLDEGKRLTAAIQAEIVRYFTAPNLQRLGRLVVCGQNYLNHEFITGDDKPKISEKAPHRRVCRRKDGQANRSDAVHLGRPCAQVSRSLCGI